jgi:hypothetical protein
MSLAVASQSQAPPIQLCCLILFLHWARLSSYLCLIWYKVGYGDLAIGIRWPYHPLPLFGISSNTPAAVVSTIVGTAAWGSFAPGCRRRRTRARVSSPPAATALTTAAVRGPRATAGRGELRHDHRCRRERGLGGARPDHLRHAQARQWAQGISAPGHRRRAQEGSDREREGAPAHTTAAAATSARVTIRATVLLFICPAYRQSHACHRPIAEFVSLY